MAHNRTILRIAEGGRIVIPVAVRESLGMDVGAEIILAAGKNRATLMSAKAARRRACERVRRYIAPDASLGEELMAERKAEARNE